MRIETRYDAALAKASEIIRLPPGEAEPVRLAQITFMVLEAIYHSEGYPARDGELFYCFHCPRCRRHYRISTALQHRLVTCLDCAFRWHAPTPERRRP